MEFEKVDIDDLVSPIWNPRKLTNREKEKLKESIKEYGYVSPVIVNKHNYHIVGGNQRVSVLKELGYDSVDVIFIDEPNLDREKALNLSLNKVNGEWDDEKLENLLVDLELNDFDLDLTGFDNLDFKEFDFDIRLKKNSSNVDSNPIKDEIIIDDAFVDVDVDVDEVEDNIVVSLEDNDTDLFESIEYESDEVTVFGETEEKEVEVDYQEEVSSKSSDKVYVQQDVSLMGKDKVNKSLNEEYKVLLTFNNKKFFEDTLKKLKLEDSKYNLKIL